VDASTDAGVGEVLAGIPSADEVDSFDVIRKVPHVLVAGGVRPVLGKHLAAIGVDLALPAHFEAGPLETEVDAADA